MHRKHQSLDELQIASPCTASWEDMAGTDRVRFCRQCQMRVYNFSTMSRNEAEQFIRQREGRTCVRFFRRSDGTVLTDDCPVGLRTLRRAARRGWAVLVGGLACVLALFVGGAVYSTGERPRTLRRLEPLATVWDWLDPPQPQPPEPTPPRPPPRPRRDSCLMGMI